MNDVKDMKVGSVYMEPEELEEQTWQEMHKNATFTHNEACEDIFYIKDQTEEELAERFSFISNDGDKMNVLDCAIEAQDLGFAYVCLYSG